MNGIAWRAWQDIWYGLVGMAWYMVLLGEVWDYGVAWPDDMYMVRPVRHGMVWSSGYGMVYGVVWQALHGI